MPSLPVRNAFRAMQDRRNEIADKLIEISWQIWALKQEDARLALQQTPGA